MSEERKQQILMAIAGELERQATDDRPGRPELSEREGAHRFMVKGEVDILALATAIDGALGADTLEAGPNPADTAGPPGAGSSPKGAYARVDEGRKPEDLNASNDE